MADKRLILAVAGSGKTSYLISQLNETERFLIVTYTITSLSLIKDRVIKRFGYIPRNVRLYSYFEFMYQFCIKPYALFEHKIKGIVWSQPDDRFLPYTNRHKYISSGYLYHNRMGKFIEFLNITSNIQARLEKFFDHFFFDEFQDLGGHDFNFIMDLAKSDVNFLFVGDFFQHTYKTSFDGRINSNLYDQFDTYCNRLSQNSITVDLNTLSGSWRCSPNICDFISKNLQIQIGSHRADQTEISYLENRDELKKIIDDDKIIKLVYDRSSIFPFKAKNWGDCKGEDDYQDTCIILNKTASKLFMQFSLIDLPPLSKNKLYVALSRTRGNCYITDTTLVQSCL